MEGIGTLIVARSTEAGEETIPVVESVAVYHEVGILALLKTIEGGQDELDICRFGGLLLKLCTSTLTLARHQLCHEADWP